MTYLLVHPGAAWSVHDVCLGLQQGLAAAGVRTIEYALDCRLQVADQWLHHLWEVDGKRGPKPALPDVVYHASKDVLERALRHDVDAVLVVSGMWLHPDILVLLRRAGVPVGIVFTESPYDTEKELTVAPLAQVVWTNERTCVARFAAVTRAHYLPHGWRPGVHDRVTPAADVPAHDVVFVGTGFAERVALLEAIDWTGLDLGLYGTWALRDDSPLRPFLREGIVDNARTAQLYARAKVGLNLYRQTAGLLHSGGATVSSGESLNPRAYELAAGGCFTVSESRAEVAAVFGDLVPTFTSAAEASALLHRWVRDDAGRQAVEAALPARVASATWVSRAAQVHAQMSAVLAARAAA